MNRDGLMHRREFFRSLGRAAALGALGLLGAGAVWRRSGECVNRGVCTGCPALVTCPLPTAQSVRAVPGVH